MLIPKISGLLTSLLLPKYAPYRSTRLNVISTSPSEAEISLQQSDNEIFELINHEQNRQFSGIELIASENFVSQAVLQALGSCLTNKYSEGLPGARYYGGNEYIDKIERICQQRALNLFKLSPEEWSVNVQPYSGSPANFAVYTALLKPHDRIMGLDLPSGGHLTHGYQTAKRRVSATSIYFESMPYRVNKQTGLIDYDEMAYLVELFKPKLLIAGGSAYPRDWDYKRMRTIADSVGAYLMADMAHISGLVATQECNNPFEYCDVVTSTTHKSLRGPRSGLIFCKKQYEEVINYAVFPSLQGGPHNHQIGGVAVALKEANTPAFKHYIQQVKNNAKALSNELMAYGYKIVTDGTDNHIVLWDVKNTTGLSGAKLEKLFEKCDISVNKNSVYGDTSAINPGGVRLGTPAMTTRGVKEADIKVMATLLHKVVQLAKEIQTSLGDDVKLVSFVSVMNSEKFASQINNIKAEVHQFATSFPLPGKNYHI